MIKIIVFSIFIAVFSGCASLDRMPATKFEPLRSDAGAQYFKFTTIADASYPLGSENAEQTRIEWLKTWLSDNNYGSNKFEIISRTPMLRSKGLFGDIYDIFYEIKVDK